MVARPHNYHAYFGWNFDNIQPKQQLIAIYICSILDKVKLGTF